PASNNAPANSMPARLNIFPGNLCGRLSDPGANNIFTIPSWQTGPIREVIAVNRRPVISEPRSGSEIVEYNGFASFATGGIPGSSLTAMIDSRGYPNAAATARATWRASPRGW
ncbi:MAG: hypothetical protein PVI79_02445, partial [Gammaproteobacteria bacterium]